MAERHGYLGWALIPTHDEQVRQLAEHSAQVHECFRYTGLPWETYRLIYDKRLAYEWFGQIGIDQPHSYIPRFREDVPGKRLKFPLIIKPAVKRTFGYYSKKKAIQVESPTELQAYLDNELKLVPIEELLYQEIIPGGGKNQWSYAGFFVDGRPVAAYTACRRRQHPPDYGRASTYVIADPDEEVEIQSRRILDLLHYTGFAEVEWKRDIRDGKLKFLEVNARCWGWHSLSSRIVGNLPKMLYEYLLQAKAEPVRPRYESCWVKWITDVPVAFDMIKRGELTLKEYVRSIRQNLVSCDWDPNDPLPFFMQFALLPFLIAKRGY
jgi:predicted ATP-grasp superfamily ATP-dependent carboligase